MRRLLAGPASLLVFLAAADIIAVHGDVLKHIDLLQRVDVVVKNGVRVK